MTEQRERALGGLMAGGAFGFCADAILMTPGLFTASFATVGGIVGYIKKANG